jgi:hypothetical protein
MTKLLQKLDPDLDPLTELIPDPKHYLIELLPNQRVRNLPLDPDLQHCYSGNPGALYVYLQNPIVFLTHFFSMTPWLTVARMQGTL